MKWIKSSDNEKTWWAAEELPITIVLYTPDSEQKQDNRWYNLPRYALYLNGFYQEHHWSLEDAQVKGMLELAFPNRTLS